MKTIKNVNIVFLMIWGLLLCLPIQAFAAFDSGSDGSDGALVVSYDADSSANVVTVNGTVVGPKLQLPEDGIFNFTTVKIESGATLYFIKNESNSPVTILTTGDVEINGTINVKGLAGNFIIPGEGGPGGYDGGVGAVVKGKGKRGEGPGGGVGAGPSPQAIYGAGGEGGAYSASGENGDAGGYGAVGGSGSTAYGNERIIPLLGGSGGGGGGGTTDDTGGAGGGGGGAILIASSGDVSVNGSINAGGGSGANGGNITSTSYEGGGGGGGAGGAIRIICKLLEGNGSILATGGERGRSRSSVPNNYTGGLGSSGRIRIEYVTTTRTASTSPPMSIGYALTTYPLDMPTLTIASIAGVEVPELPMGDFNAPDVTLPFGTSNPVPFVVNATNIPTGSTVTLYSSPSVGSSTNASSAFQGTDSASSASVDLSISMAYPSVIYASVTYELTASVGGPFMLDGELIVKARVTASMGGGSELVYITENGREISANNYQPAKES